MELFYSRLIIENRFICKHHLWFKGHALNSCSLTFHNIPEKQLPWIKFFFFLVCIQVQKTIEESLQC